LQSADIASVGGGDQGQDRIDAILGDFAKQIDRIVGWQLGDQYRDLFFVLGGDQLDLSIDGEVLKHLGLQGWLCVLQDSPGFLVVEAFHELGGAGRVERSAKLAEFVGAILCEHFSEFRKEQGVHRALIGSDREIEIATQIAPNRVDVVGLCALRIGLVIAKFGDETRSLESDEVLFFRIDSTGPAEVDLIHAGSIDDLPSFLGDGLGHRREVGIDDRFEFCFLLGLQTAGWDAYGLIEFGLWLASPLDIGWAFGVEDCEGALGIAQALEEFVGSLFLGQEQSGT
jgi:hypothetical protein